MGSLFVELYQVFNSLPSNMDVVHITPLVTNPQRERQVYRCIVFAPFFCHFYLSVTKNTKYRFDKNFISIRLISLSPPKDDLERTSNGQGSPPKLIQTSVVHGFSCLTYIGRRIRSPDLNPFLQVVFKNIVSAVTDIKQGCRSYSPCNWQYNVYHKTITSNFDDIPSLLAI